MAASGLVDRANGAGALAELRAQLRAATLRPEAAASGEALADLTPVQEALERAGVRAGWKLRAPISARDPWWSGCSSSFRSTARRARRS
jgi:hypothetical protein